MAEAVIQHILHALEYIVENGNVIETYTDFQILLGGVPKIWGEMGEGARRRGSCRGHGWE
jgi:hypothetical protein